MLILVIFAVENNKQISRFVEYSSRGMNSFFLEKNYWKCYNYQVDVSKLYELRKNEEEENKMVMDDNDIQGKSKKKRTNT